MRVAGLFAGIGGFELGLQRAGHEADLLCDVLPASKAVLQARFPDVEYRDDITKLRSLPASVDLISAGSERSLVMSSRYSTSGNRACSTALDAGSTSHSKSAACPAR